jgi:hypothetical protein
VVGFLGPYGRGPATAKLPTRRAAVRAHEPTLAERAADPFANLILARRFDSEQRAQVDVVIDALRGGVMWSERTWRLWSPWPQSATVIAAPGAPTSPSASMVRTASWANGWRTRLG